MVKDMPKLVCEITINGSPTLKALTSTSNLDSVANAIKTTPGVGKPFLFFNSLPQPGHPTLCDFDLHPDWAGFGNLVTSNNADNRAMIDAMLLNPPLDALTW